jgi:hypothetical protein
MQKLMKHQEHGRAARSTNRRPTLRGPTAVRRSVAQIEHGRKLPTLIEPGEAAAARATIGLMPWESTGSPTHCDQTSRALISRKNREGACVTPMCLVAVERHLRKGAGQA